MSLMAWLLLVAAGCALMGLLLLRRSRRRRPVLPLMAALLFLTLALALSLLGLGLRQFQRLSADQPVALIGVAQLGEQHFRVGLEDGAGPLREFDLHGDQWQLDARVLRWQLPALVAGAPPLYRLERISGRYADITREREATRSVYALDHGALRVVPDLFDLKRRHPRWLPFVDARYGSAAYLPMLDGARYEVLFNPRGGLVARPADAQTERLLDESGW